MSLRTKTLIIIFIPILIVIGLIYIASRIILLDSFTTLEEGRVRTNIGQAMNVLEQELSSLDTMTHDWAWLDDTYSFVVNPNDAYIQTNVVDDSFLNLQLNLMIFTNSAGDIVYGKAFDLEDETEIPVPGGVMNYLSSPDAKFLHHSSTESSLSGILMLPEGPMLVSSNPILTSEGEGPVHGALIWGRYLNDAVIGRFKESTLLSLDLVQIDTQMPIDFQKANSSLIEGEAIFITTLSDDSIAGYTLMRDIYGKPALILRVDMPREIYNQGIVTIDFFLSAFLVVCLAFGVSVYFHLGRLIVSRLAKLSGSVGNIGKRHDLSARVTVSGNDEISVLGNAINATLTELEESQQALSDSERKYSTLVEKGNDGIVMIQDGLLVFANTKMIELTGFPLNEVIGKPFLDFVSPAFKELITTYYRKRLAGENAPSRYEAEMVAKDSRVIPVEISAAIIDYNGKPSTLAVVRDISERKRMQEQLIITDRLASIGELASGVAHELNNPLTSVIGFSQLLMEREVPPDIEQDVKTIYNEARRAAQVVKNLLTFARKHAPLKQPVNVNDVIEKVLELRAYEHKLNNIQVVKYFDPDLPEVIADYFQLQQVFLNIVINAEYFVIEAHRKGTLTIITKRHDNTVRVSFTDNGPGIAKENLGHLFDPFFTTKEVGKGTGLGLSICHGIVFEHGGRTYAESKPGEGATFIVELPLTEP